MLELLRVEVIGIPIGAIVFWAIGAVCVIMAIRSSMPLFNSRGKNK